MKVLALILVAGLAGRAYASDADDMAAAANGFYTVYSTFHPSDGIPAEKARAQLAPYLSPALRQLLVDGDAAEQRYAQATKNMSPPLVEGDLFTSNFEGATAWHVGRCEAGASGGRCTVALGYRDPTREDPKPVNWADTIYLVHTSAGWRIDDIGYGSSAAFANKGRLTGVVKDALRDAADVTP